MTASERPAGLSLRIARIGLFGAGAVFSLTPLATPALALGGGMLVALGLGNPWPRLTGSLGSSLLRAAVVGLGFGVPLDRLLSTGVAGAAYTVLLIAGVFALGLHLGRWMAIERNLSVLITAGTSICGGSAIAALGPSIGASRETMSVSLATVFIYNAVALYVFPPVGHLLDMSQHQFGVWAALAIHDTSSVVGAAASFGPLALQEATVLKLTRALFILPLVLIARLELHRTNTLGALRRLRLPWFIALFVVAAIARSLVSADAIPWFDTTSQIARRALVLTLFLIGASLTRAQLRAVGFRPLAHGLVLWLSVASATLVAVLWGVRP
jgi:uncharacterized integral membrane protein (TIGR00698 family)